MQTEFEQIILKLNEYELWDLLFSVKRDLEDEIKNHWSKWIEKRNKESYLEYVLAELGNKFKMYKTFSYRLNRPDMVQEIEDLINKIWDNQ
jgi:antirestriction protein